MKKLILSSALFLVACLADAQISPTATVQAPVSSVSSSSELQLRGSAPTMFATVVKRAGLSGGVLVSNNGCSHPPEKVLSLPAGIKFENAVARIANLGPKSKWSVQDGVADFLLDGVVSPLLQVQIESFTWDKATPFRVVLGRVRQLPEVIEAASKLGLREAPYGGGASAICVRGGCGEKAQPESVIETEKNVPLLTLLNRVAQAHNGAVWDYSEFHCDKGTLFSLSVLAE